MASIRLNTMKNEKCGGIFAFYLSRTAFLSTFAADFQGSQCRWAENERIKY